MKKILFNLLSLIFISSCTVSTPVAPASTPVVAPTPRADWKTYKSAIFPVSFQHPSKWGSGDRDPDNIRGEDGFVSLNYGYIDGVSIFGVCAGEAYQLTPWYGLNPSLETLSISGFDSCLVLPSDDQDFGMKGQSVAIARLPSPIQIKNSKANLIMLFATKKYVREIVATLHITP